MDKELIEIYIVNLNYGLIFNPNQISALRAANIRICGHLIGTLANNCYQINEFGSPLLLTNEEIKLLFYLNAFKIRCLCKFELLSDTRLEYEKYLERQYNEQNASYKQKRENELVSLKTKIIAGKRKSIADKIKMLELQGETSNEKKIVELKNELESLNEGQLCLQVNELSRNDINTEIFLQIPEFSKNQYKISCIDFCQYLTITSKINFKYIIYKYLWSLGYYLTSNACKFGGDYLVYKGDPYQFHAKFILLCLNEEKFKDIRIRELIHYGRVATNVKKSYLIACVLDTDDVNIKNKINFESEKLLFTCIRWSHI